MSRWWLVALACVASLLVWLMATWPMSHEEETADIPAAENEAPVAQANHVAAPPPPAAEPAVEEPSAPEPAPEPSAAAEPAAPAAPAAEAEIFTRENGPLAEYKAQFEKEPRDSAATEAEQVVRDAFHPQDSPKPVFRSVLCRETICRIETRFSADNMGGYVAAMTRMVHSKFGSQLASERTSTAAEAGEVSVTVYAKRPPPAE